MSAFTGGRIRFVLCLCDLTFQQELLSLREREFRNPLTPTPLPAQPRRGACDGAIPIHFPLLVELEHRFGRLAEYFGNS